MGIVCSCMYVDGSVYEGNNFASSPVTPAVACRTALACSADVMESSRLIMGMGMIH